MFKGDVDLGSVVIDGKTFSAHLDLHEGKYGIIVEKNKDCIFSLWFNKKNFEQFQEFVGKI